MNNDRLGKFIKKLRIEKKLTQEQLANEICVSRTLVNKWEKGSSGLTLDNLLLLSNYFGIEINEFVYEKKDYKYNKILNNKNFKLFLFSFSLIIILALFFVNNSKKNNDLIYTYFESDFKCLNAGIFFKSSQKLYFQLDANIVTSNNYAFFDFMEDNDNKNIKRNISQKYNVLSQKNFLSSINKDINMKKFLYINFYDLNNELVKSFKLYLK